MALWFFIHAAPQLPRIRYKPLNIGLDSHIQHYLLCLVLTRTFIVT